MLVFGGVYILHMQLYMGFLINLDHCKDPTINQLSVEFRYSFGIRMKVVSHWNYAGRCRVKLLLPRKLAARPWKLVGKLLSCCEFAYFQGQTVGFSEGLT